MKSKIILFILLAFLGTGFIVYKNSKNNNQIPPIEESLSEDLLIEEYLNKNILKPEYEGKVFCSFYKYGSEEKDNQIFYYLWAYCEEYYKKDNKVSMGSGVSMPVRLNSIKNGNQIEIKNFEQPIDGEGYLGSIKNMFPENYATEAINGFDISTLSENPKEKAYKFFNVQ